MMDQYAASWNDYRANQSTDSLRARAEPLLPLLADGRTAMAQLRVRNPDDALVQALKHRAAKHNRSAEQEHREILKEALLGPKRRSLTKVLLEMPNVGSDADFERADPSRRG
jgi:plasmid stability protein